MHEIPARKEPFYEERTVTKEELQKEYAKYHLDKLGAFIDSIEEGDKVFYWRKSRGSSFLAGGGASGYYRLLPNGERRTLVMMTWMS